MNGLLQSRRFWISIVAVAQSVVFGLIPDFPDMIWQAIDALAVALITTIAIEDAATKREGGAPDG